MNRRILSLFIISIGALIMTVTGLCTVTVGIPSIFFVFKEAFAARSMDVLFNQSNLFSLGLVVGGGVLPFMLGFFIFRIGRTRLKKADIQLPPVNLPADSDTTSR
jgi:hypothetical protein